MKRLIVVSKLMQIPSSAEIWCEPVNGPVRAVPTRAPDLVLTGDDIAGQLYWAGIRHDVAELAIDIAGMGQVLNRELCELCYPRLYHEQTYRKDQIGWIRTARTEASA